MSEQPWTVETDADGLDRLHVAKPDWIDIERMGDDSWCIIISVEGHLLYVDLETREVGDGDVIGRLEVDR